MRKYFLFLLVVAAPCLAQAQGDRTASIAGRITRGDQSVVRMLVTAQRANQLNGWERPQLTVRGQFNFVGGELPPGTRLHIGLRKMNGAVVQDYRMTQVDVKGRFLFEGLLAGAHELVVNLSTTLKLAAVVRQQFNAPQTITVAANAETPVTLTLDLRDPEK